MSLNWLVSLRLTTEISSSHYYITFDRIFRYVFPVRVYQTQAAVPLHALEALGGRGDIAPTHSRPRH